MIIERQILEEVLLLKPQVFEDDRGYFFESFKQNQFKDFGLDIKFVQDNEVYSSQAGILRGLHYQLKNPQGKLVRVIVGSIIDVAVDIRLGSPTFGQYHLVKLNAHNKLIFYIPEGFAHGYLVTSKESIVLYKCTNEYNPKDEYGIKWDDDEIGIKWGNDNPILSKKDKELPLLRNQKRLPKY